MNRSKILELTCKVLITTVLISIGIGHIYGQEKSSVKWIEFRYGLHFPLEDMSERFGTSSDIGVCIEAAGFQRKVFFGADGVFIFGSVVREDVLAGLRSFDGSIVGIDGKPGDINLKERGFYVGFNVGKIFPTSAKVQNLTGFRAQLGAGLMQHKIRVQDNFKTIIPLLKENLKGYDRLTNGPAMHLALGFQYQNPKNNFHFNIMADLYGARTRSRRDFDNSSGGYLADKRTDILAGFSLGYVVSITRNTRPENIYY